MAAILRGETRIPNEPFSCLSLNVRHLFKTAVEIPKSKLSYREENQTYIYLEDCTFVAKNLALILEDFLGDNVTEHDSQMLSTDKLKVRNVEFYERVLTTLCPIFYMCHSCLTLKYKGEINGGNLTEEENLKSNQAIVSDELFEWLSDRKVVQDCMNEIMSGMSESRNFVSEEFSQTSQLSDYVAQTNSTSANTNAISALLLLTPVLERSLGNVLASTLSTSRQITSHKVPALLRDLILNETLQDLVDSKVIVFLLHVLMGTPRSLNLRNIVWHGFSSSSGTEQFAVEMSSILVSTLLILIRTLGKTFLQKKMSGLLPMIQSRKQVSLKRITKIYTTFKVDEMEKICDKLKREIESCDMKNSFMRAILHQKKNIIVRCLNSYVQGNFWLSLCLILPEWECVARILFAVVNKCEERIQTAESEAFYTTFDEILASKLNNGDENLFSKWIGMTHMELLMDLLVLPEGPRLRDKMSHGEVDRNEKSTKMCVELVIASYIDLLSILQNIEHSKYVEADNNTTISISLSADYKSQYHSTVLLIEDLDAALSDVENLLPENHDLWPIAIAFECENNDFVVFKKDQDFMKEVNNLILKLSRYLDHPQCWKEEESFNTVHISKLLQTVLLYINYLNGVNGNDKICFGVICKIRVSTLYRSKREYELWSIFRKILWRISSAAQKIIDNMKEKKHHFENQSLRSRQRNTYKRMLKIIPLIHMTFLFMFINILNNLLDFYENTIVDIDEDEFCRKLKKSKKYLKMCENFETYVDKGKNRWEEATEIVKDFIQVMTS